MPSKAVVSTVSGGQPMAHAAGDEDLLEAVAQKRDREAFAELYHRHEQAAYNLAYHLTRDRDAAEEALQEALLRAWKSADSYRAEGSARGWFLRIVARESLRKARNRRKERGAMQANENLELQAAPAAEGPELERGETLTVLRRMLEQLPDLDRQLLALHFGAGLSQEEAGTALALSQQAISFRMKKALEHLRSGLTRAGLAGAVGLMESGGLSEALCSGRPLPPGLGEKVLGHFAQAARHSMRSVRAGPALWPQGTAGIWIAGTLLVSAGVAAWMGWGTPKPSHEGVAAVSKVEKPASLPAEVVYDDAFDGQVLDPFWVKVNPPNTDKALACVLLNSKLLIVAASAGNFTKKYNKGLYPAVELVSRRVELDERPVEIHMDLSKMGHNGAYLSRVELLDQAGRLFYQCTQKRPKVEGDPESGCRIGAKEFLNVATYGYIRFRVDAKGQVETLSDQGKRLQAGQVPGPLTAFTLHLHLEVIGVGWADWTYDRITIRRLQYSPEVQR